MMKQKAYWAAAWRVPGTEEAHAQSTVFLRLSRYA
jgi:hypothetical protein